MRSKPLDREVFLLLLKPNPCPGPSQKRGPTPPHLTPLDNSFLLWVFNLGCLLTLCSSSGLTCLFFSNPSPSPSSGAGPPCSCPSEWKVLEEEPALIDCTPSLPPHSPGLAVWLPAPPTTISWKIRSQLGQTPWPLCSLRPC